MLPALAPPTTPVVSPPLRRPNHFIFNVPSRRALGLQFDASNSSAPIDVVVTNPSGKVILSTTVPSTLSGHQLTTVSFPGTIGGGNYELDVAPRDDAQVYTVSTTDPAVTLALKDGADLAQSGSSL